MIVLGTCSYNYLVQFYKLYPHFIDSGNNDKTSPFLTIGASTTLSMTFGTRTISSNSSTGNMTGSRHRNMLKNILHVLSISASVTRIRWRPVSNDKCLAKDGEDRHDAMIAVATSQIKGASAGGSGLLSLWSYHRPYMPLSVVEGHKEGAVVDFDWLDTPQNATSLGAVNVSTAHASIFSAESTTSRLPGVSSREVDSILYDGNGQTEEIEGSFRIWQHVISVGRDGCCLVQSLVRGKRHFSSQFPLISTPFTDNFGLYRVIR
jgi:WD repeat-containing protein 24